MKFSYSAILGDAPCIALTKNLRYKKDDLFIPIRKGEIMLLSTNKSKKYNFSFFHFQIFSKSISYKSTSG